MNRRLAVPFACACLCTIFAACNGPDCRSGPHVPFEAVERQVEGDVLIVTRQLISGTAMRRRPGYILAGPPTRGDECYWYLEVFPSPKAAVKRRGFYMFEADTGKLAGESTTIVHIDHFHTPAPR